MDRFVPNNFGKDYVEGYLYIDTAGQEDDSEHNPHHAYMSIEDYNIQKLKERLVDEYGLSDEALDLVEQIQENDYFKTKKEMD